ncbi:hypothetical protein Esti_001744 [Eimeria stiedai]
MKGFLFAFEKLLAAFVPRLAAKLAALGLPPEVYLVQWLLSVFSVDFELPLSLRLLDLLILRGLKALVQAALALLQAIQEPIFSMGFEEALLFIRAAAAAAPFADLTPRDSPSSQHSAAAAAAAVAQVQPRQAQRQRWGRRAPAAKRQVSDGIELQQQQSMHEQQPSQEQQQQQQHFPQADAPAVNGSSSSRLSQGEAWLLQRMQRFCVKEKMLRALEAAYSQNRDCRLVFSSDSLGGPLQWRLVFVLCAGEEEGGPPVFLSSRASPSGPPPPLLKLVADHFEPQKLSKRIHRKNQGGAPPGGVPPCVLGASKEAT